MKDVKVAAVQIEHADGDKAANLDKIRTFTARAAREGVRIIAFPECCLTGYWFLRRLSRPALEALSEPVDGGPSARALLALAAENRITVGAGLVERADDGTLYNTYLVAMPDGRLARHRKIHAFISEHIASGNEYTVFDDHGSGCRLGVLTCYDNNIIENCRMAALRGVEILLAPHQTGGCASSNPHQMGLVERRLWERRHEDPAAIEAEFRGEKGRGWLMRWLPSRAHDNGFFLVFSNGVGIDDDEIRTGNAMIIDPYGRILDETGAAGDAMVIAECPAALRDERTTGLRWITTRRPELYGPLAQPTGREVDTRTARFRK